ncbi:MAG TPA: penicillin-binding transpeptidase domain-containing protein [Fibrobacteria bacterium]|nr:penicillin-binding transpeptidase domain-containing protein [Fibrobacteria bacterium]
MACALASLLAFKKYSRSPSAPAAKDSRGGISAAAAFVPGNPFRFRAEPPADVPAAAATAADWQTPMRNYPRPDTFDFQGNAMVADYAPDSLLNARVKVYLERYRPETGVIMIADLRSGHVLAMGEREDSVITGAPRLAYGGGFPAASLIKILTATAALECKARELTDSIPQLGGYHTLYKRQLRTEGQHRYPKITLEEAFSKSVNPAFGMLGLSMGPEALRATASRMGFNRAILPSCVAKSRIEFPDSGFSLAEAACGFTAKTTISPWHALQIARGAGDDGRLRPCSFARTIVDLGSGAERPVTSDTGGYFVSPANLGALQGFMQATVRTGTARKGFHSVLRAGHLEKIEAGGKTGSLDGEETRGRFDWFIGYVKLKDDPARGLAFSIMLVHREYSSIHASQLAALLIRDWLTACEKAAKARKAEMAYRAA